MTVPICPIMRSTLPTILRGSFSIVTTRKRTLMSEKLTTTQSPLATSPLATSPLAASPLAPPLATSPLATSPLATSPWPPLSQRRVQWTLAAIASVAIASMIVAGNVSSRQHNVAEDFGENTLLRIDLNSAQSRELALLPGVGPVLAKRIVENRNRLGPFRTVDDLSRVHGIGPKTIERLGDVCEVRLDRQVTITHDR